MKNGHHYLIVELCMGSSCYCRGNKTLAIELKELIARRFWENLVVVRGCLCKDSCAKGPNLSINGEACPVQTIGGLEKHLEQLLASKELPAKKPVSTF